MLITEAYRAQQVKLHENAGYGVASLAHAPAVLSALYEARVSTLLDYGAGKGRLGDALRPHGVTVIEYDPARPGWDAAPEPCEFVACIDVLEHIEPELLDAVLDDLRRVTVRHGLFTVHTGPAAKTLPDGRNAHLIQKPWEWWAARLVPRFNIVGFEQYPEGFRVTVDNGR